MSDSDLEFVSLVQLAAEERRNAHPGDGRAWSEGYEEVGIAGEVAFSRAFKLPLDLERRTAGDGGIDFFMPTILTVDVKTYRRPDHLPVEVGKVKADIYVLAGYRTSVLDAELIGWEFRAAVQAAPTRKLTERGVLSHCIHRDQLRPIEDLRRRLAVVGFYVGDGA